MAFSSDRVSGLFFFIAGLLCYFYVIPTFVESANSGSLHPDTFPNALSLLIAICGIILAVNPTNHRLHSTRDMLMSAVYFSLICAALFAMTFFGYVVVSPFLAILLMLLIGERRPVWLFSGVVIMPATIWFIVEVLLERGLP
ncbi:Tripartite tricarboxylate transporter TctB family protein (plasmid) [Phaeobacter inhibens]|uniref:Tripartite tricarboxylate transporter TctB family protein n=1 Tax=Phaeobacter inhibens TaxID=221822 RepID=A0ABM6RKJ7_9RHOB|nr:tripartite tricarboxylate transporter TctB family protein [Phaeobacter inhibens]AUQ52482.1 Tripartite tricarboxylate transporter TctB family protein [Phaeobacter inhibens]AUQ97087.1 Tripartite tricarboxylate transporter TctB family protein [Phaeobacter inhibens]AUR22287.1 Tripartite tricarboxylate transporter TctB family protein [Phaeobacter inhibens]